MDMWYRLLVLVLCRRRRIFGGYVLAKFGEKWLQEDIRRKNRSKISKSSEKRRTILYENAIFFLFCTSPPFTRLSVRMMDVIIEARQIKQFNTVYAIVKGPWWSPKERKTLFHKNMPGLFHVPNHAPKCAKPAYPIIIVHAIIDCNMMRHDVLHILA